MPLLHTIIFSHIFTCSLYFYVSFVSFFSFSLPLCFFLFCFHCSLIYSVCHIKCVLYICLFLFAPIHIFYFISSLSLPTSLSIYFFLCVCLFIHWCFLLSFTSLSRFPAGFPFIPKLFFTRKRSQNRTENIPTKGKELLVGRGIARQEEERR